MVALIATIVGLALAAAAAVAVSSKRLVFRAIGGALIFAASLALVAVILDIASLSRRSSATGAMVNSVQTRETAESAASDAVAASRRVRGAHATQDSMSDRAN